MKYDYDRMEIYIKRNEKLKIQRLAHRNGKSVSRFLVESALGEEVARE